jgi:hypothetical protein
MSRKTISSLAARTSILGTLALLSPTAGFAPAPSSGERNASESADQRCSIFIHGICDPILTFCSNW